MTEVQKNFIISIFIKKSKKSKKSETLNVINLFVKIKLDYKENNNYLIKN